ncbi:hypothetical protein [Terribacillus saccharophilus]|uniref:hypothetical protein n=1 Tax=Terribacillus saccharophilus TaxID=361277 RepID=UPI0027BAF087|nr:hypothetical protein [Terribacillus saccharophilus]
MSRLRDKGVNTTIPMKVAMELEESQPDLCCLSATQYTLLQHKNALHRIANMKKVSVLLLMVHLTQVALLGGPYFDYKEALAEIKVRAKQFEEIAQRHYINLKVAALQFSTAHPSVTAVISGSTRGDRIKEDLAAMKEIPAAVLVGSSKVRTDFSRRSSTE